MVPLSCIQLSQKGIVRLMEYNFKVLDRLYPITKAVFTYSSVTIPAHNRGQKGLLQEVVLEKPSQLLIGLKEILQEFITGQEAVTGGGGMGTETCTTHIKQEWKWEAKLD